MRIPCAASLFLFAAGLYLPPLLSFFSSPFSSFFLRLRLVLFFCVLCVVVFFALAVSFLLLLFLYARSFSPVRLPIFLSIFLFYLPSSSPPSLFFCHCTMLLPSHCAVMFLLLCCFVCCRLRLLIFLFFIVKAPERKFCCFYTQQHKTQASLGL